jgi:hypothetical protein
VVLTFSELQEIIDNIRADAEARDQLDRFEVEIDDEYTAESADDLKRLDTKRVRTLRVWSPAASMYLTGTYSNLRVYERDLEGFSLFRRVDAVLTRRERRMVFRTFEVPTFLWMLSALGFLCVAVLLAAQPGVPSNAGLTISVLVCFVVGALCYGVSWLSMFRPSVVLLTERESWLRHRAPEVAAVGALAGVVAAIVAVMAYIGR